MEQLGDLPEAIADCDRALDRLNSRPPNPNEHYNLFVRASLCKALPMEASGNSAAALILLDELVEFSLHCDERPMVERALLRNRLGDFEAARADFEIALKLEESDSGFTHEPAIVARSPLRTFSRPAPTRRTETESGP